MTDWEGSLIVTLGGAIALSVVYVEAVKHNILPPDGILADTIIVVFAALLVISIGLVANLAFRGLRYEYRMHKLAQRHREAENDR